MNSYDEWKHKQRIVGAAPDISALRIAQQAAVSAELLIGDEKWDRFLTYLQSALDAAKHSESGWVMRITDSKTSTEEMIEAKNKIHEVRGSIATLEWVMTLPKILGDIGAKARQMELSLPERG